MELFKESSSSDWGESNKNPMVRAFGKGPNGITCKECHYYIPGHGKCFYTSPVTYHDDRWHCCSKFEG